MSDETTICRECGNAIFKPEVGGSWLCVDCETDKEKWPQDKDAMPVLCYCERHQELFFQINDNVKCTHCEKEAAKQSVQQAAARARYGSPKWTLLDLGAHNVVQIERDRCVAIVYKYEKASRDGGKHMVGDMLAAIGKEIAEPSTIAPASLETPVE